MNEIKWVFTKIKEDWIQYWKDVKSNPYKIINDILNGLWKLYSGAGIGIAGVYLSAYGANWFAGYISITKDSVIWNNWPMQLVYLLLVSSPAITGAGFGIWQMVKGKGIFHIEAETKVTKEKTNDGSK
jgi:hypothetical protein